MSSNRPLSLTNTITPQPGAYSYTIPLMAAQHSMYLSNKSHPDRSIYHHSIAMQLNGPVNEKLLIQSFQEMIHRHDALRSVIVKSNEGVAQKILPPTLLSKTINDPIQIIDASELHNIPPVSNLNETLKDLGHEAFLNQPIRLDTGPLWKAALIRYSKNCYQFVLVFHHIIFDVASQNILLNELSLVYNSLLTNEKISLPTVSLSRLAHLPNASSPENIHYWKETLKTHTPLTLMTDAPAQPSEFQGDRIPFEIDSKTVAQLKHSANTKDGLTLHMMLVSSLALLLYRYSGQDHICIGTASANRRHPIENIEHMINCFTNSIPLSINLSGDPTFRALTHRVKETAINAYKHQMPIDAITLETLEEKTTKTPFDTIFVLNNEKTRLHLNNVKSSYPVELNLGNTKFKHFGINLDMHEDGSLHGFIEFNRALFTPSYFQHFKEHWKTLLNGVIHHPDAKLSDLPILTRNEINQWNNFNATEKQPSFTGFVHELFKQIAEQYPEKKAVVFHRSIEDKESITYKKLDTLSDELAAFLIATGISPGVTVGVSVTRSINLIITLLAIYKAGGIVVPLETNTLDAFKIIDADLHHIFVDNKTKSLFKNVNTKFFLLNIDRLDDMIKLNRKLTHRYHKPNLTLDNLAYIRYTSGTTGNPKGVMIPHRGLTNQVNELADRQLKQGSKILSTASFTFDAFEFDWLMTLAKSGELHLIYEEGRFSPTVLETIIQREKIVMATLTPSVLASLNPEQLADLEYVISMGAAPSKQLIQTWLKHGKEFSNEYGPTENTICSTRNHCEPEEPITTIGKPVLGVQIYISADGKTICPPGIPGQMFIGGNQLALGYMNDESLTKKKFPTKIINFKTLSFHDAAIAAEAKALTLSPLQNPSSRKPKRSLSPIQPAEKPDKKKAKHQSLMRFYETGDDGYLHPQFNKIVFLGRKDSQIKIRGTRLELEGVIATLTQHPSISECTILPTEDKESLIAYIVPKSSQTVTREDINQFLAKTNLPRVARVSHVELLEKMPLNTHGKIDTKLLPQPTNIAQNNISPPTTNLQKIIHECWAEVLKMGHDQFGIHQDFYDLGGDSLRFAKLESLINHRLSLDKYFLFTAFSNTISVKKMADILQPIYKPKPISSIRFFNLPPEFKSAPINLNAINTYSLPQSNNAPPPTRSP